MSDEPANSDAWIDWRQWETLKLEKNRAHREIGLLNLMPKKIQTENQFARLIGATPLQIDFRLIRMSEHETKNTAAEHMAEFYRPFQEIKDEKFDGLIITGAPIEHLPFEEVTYWDELKEVMDWTQTNVHMTFGVCWGGMAMAYHFHGLEKHMLPHKAFGCFRHQNLSPASPYLRGFSDDFSIPVSRWTEVRRDDIPADSGMTRSISSVVVSPASILRTAADSKASMPASRARRVT